MRAWLLVLAGCTLVHKAQPLEIRYYSPELPRAAEQRQPTAANRIRVRLGQVTASEHLRERIAYRESALKIGLYNERRWTEEPDAYVRRSLGRALFERGPFEQALGGAAPTLDVEVIAFEEVRAVPARATEHPPGMSARVELSYRLRDDRTVITSGRFTIERPVHGDFESTVAAIGAAMEAASERLTRIVVTAVADSRGPPSSGGGSIGAGIGRWRTAIP